MQRKTTRQSTQINSYSKTAVSKEENELTSIPDKQNLTTCLSCPYANCIKACARIKKL